MRVVEATAPCALRLGPRLALALDRRAWCRVEPIAAGLELESKDDALRAVAVSLETLELGASLDWTRPLLRHANDGAGLRIAMHGRVPAATGLPVRAALAAALAAALRGSRGEPTSAEAVVELAGRAPGVDPVDLWTALLGGVVSIPAVGRPLRVKTDPAKIEERLLLLDVGLPATVSGGPEPDAAQRGRDLLEALARAAFDELGSLLEVPLHETVPTEAPARHVAEQVRARGGHSWLCAGGAAGLMAVWIAPDGRRALLDWVRSAALGVRPVACRLDLLGLDMEQV